MENSKNCERSDKLQRKPSMKTKTIPQIKHTRTSYQRYLKANPLLKYEEEGRNISKILTEMKSCTSSTTEIRPTTKIIPPRHANKDRKNVEKKLEANKDLAVLKESIISGNRPLQSQSVANGGPKNVKPPKILIKKANHGDFKPTEIKRSLSRRSRSCEINRKESSVPLPNSQITKFSQSQENIDGSICMDFVFKTPSAYKRRSIYHVTPKSIKRDLSFETSTPAPMRPESLQLRLEQWLKKRGKSLSSFTHLKCFGLNHGPIEEENKENIDTSLPCRSESFENLKIEPTEKSSEEPNEEEGHRIAKEALSELQTLIREGYPTEPCLLWLQLIKEKNKQLEEEPEYWECRAAIEQCAGNISNAVEFYKTAIVQGAEVNTIDKSLDELLKKFSLLNISPNVVNRVTDQKRESIVRDARNIFKSSIIQFAIQQRKIKKHEHNVPKKLVVTPVRRSTRLSLLPNNSQNKLFESLKDISLKDYEFQKNKALC